MVKKMYLILAGFLLSGLAFSQNSTSPLVGNSEAIKSIQILNDLAEKVNTSYSAYQQSATGSRSSSSQAKEQYETALSLYLAELYVQVENKSNAENSESIQQEIELVKKIQTNQTGTPAK